MSHTHRVRYVEVDAQGVVFNAWYLAFFDDAMTAFLADRGLPYQAMLDAGYDVQLVRSEVDWVAGARFQDELAIAVTCSRIGTTSFVLDFDCRRSLDDEGQDPICTGRTVYVVVATDGSGKRPVPPLIANALGHSRS